MNDNISSGCTRYPNCWTCPFADCIASQMEIKYWDERRKMEQKAVTASEQREAVAKLHAKGKTNKEIAKEIGTSSTTVAKRLAEMYFPEKLAKLKEREKKRNKDYRDNRKSRPVSTSHKAAKENYTPAL